MKDRLIPLAPYAALLAADFYLLPPLARDTGAAMLLMLCVMPLAAFITALACGMRRGFSPLLPAAAFTTTPRPGSTPWPMPSSSWRGMGWDGSSTAGGKAGPDFPGAIQSRISSAPYISAPWDSH